MFTWSLGADWLEDLGGLSLAGLNERVVAVGAQSVQRIRKNSVHMSFMYICIHK